MAKRRLPREIFANIFFPRTHERVFFAEELDIESIKWLKRILMARTGLIAHEELNTQIVRHKLSELFMARRECARLASEAESKNINFVIVLKVVPKDSVGLLRNFHVSSSATIEDVFLSIENYIGTQSESDRELWFCLSVIDPGTLSLGGRINFSKGSTTDRVELIWYANPRRIEEFSTRDDFEFPFYRAIRPIGIFSFQTELIHVPENYKRNKSNPVVYYMEEAEFVLRKIWKYWVEIKATCDIIFEAGASELSIDFILNNGTLRFIDWDTEHDLFR